MVALDAHSPPGSRKTQGGRWAGKRVPMLPLLAPCLSPGTLQVQITDHSDQIDSTRQCITLTRTMKEGLISSEGGCPEEEAVGTDSKAE